MHTFTLTAVDSVGHERSTTLDVIIDSEFPEAGITEAEGSIILGETFTISGFARDDIEVTKVLLFIDDGDPITITYSYQNGIWEYDLDTTGMSPGRHIISIMVYDSVDNQVYTDSRIKIIEETTPIEEVEEPEEEEDNKIGPFKMEMFVLILIITIMCIIAIGAMVASRGKKK